MMNDKRKIDLLVLDAHGVVFTSSFRQFLTLLADERRQPREDLLQKWRDGVRVAAWTGTISESEIWRRLGLKTLDEIAVARELMVDCFKVGFAGARLPEWSLLAPIWILSNHRSEWLLPRTRKFQLDEYIAKVIVSDQVGAVKPDPAAFYPISSLEIAPSRVLFVDDQPRNLDAASRLGFQVVHATNDGSWTKSVDLMLMRGQDSEQPCQTHSPTTY